MGKGCVFPSVQKFAVRTTFALSFFIAKQVDNVLDFIMLTREATRIRIKSRQLPKCFVLKENSFGQDMPVTYISMVEKTQKSGGRTQSWFSENGCILGGN